MKIQDQVCTLEQAKRLKELGVEQGNIFCYYIQEGSAVNLYTQPDLAFVPFERAYAAYTVGEVGLILSVVPNSLEVSSVSEVPPEPKNIGEIYNIEYMANLAIYLLENNLITPEEVNSRLTS